jgi:hypothetical protein
MARPALHACRLELVHPERHEAMGWSCAPPADMSTWMRQLGARPQQLRAPAKLSIVLAAAAAPLAAAEVDPDDLSEGADLADLDEAP